VLSGKVLSDDFFHAAATAHDKNDHILYQQKSGMLFYDADGKKPGADRCCSRYWTTTRRSTRATL
jgi:hypothetical protein